MPIPNKFFDRLVIQLEPDPESEAQRLRGPLSSFLHHEHIVLLGEPGSGKTVLFEQFAAYEQTQHIKLSSFNRKPADQIENHVLYLDGLDECRVGNRHQRNAINDVVTKLFAINPTKVRISCRERDWLGATDLIAFNDFFDNHGSTVVLKLEPLSEQEQMEFLLNKGIQSPSQFLSQAQNNGLNNFLGNPLTLGMLAETVSTNNWPTSRTQLFEQFSLLLLREINPTHAEQLELCTEAEMSEIAGSLMAHQLLSGIDSYSLNPSSHTTEQPFYIEIGGYKPEKIHRVLNSRLFYCDPNNQTTSYFHRTIAEYLAAKWLAEKVRQGLPVERVCALLGFDGNPTIELKGLYAWMPVFAPEVALHFIYNDPYGVMTYGDVGQLSQTSKLAVVHALTRMANNDPWFHSRDYSDAFARGFITPELKSALAKIVDDTSFEFHLRILLVDLIARSSEVNAYLDLLSSLLSSPKNEYAVRSAASKGLAQSEISEREIRSIYVGLLSESEPDIPLIANVIEDFYGRVFSVNDAIELIDLIAKRNERLSIGSIWGLRGLLTPAEALFFLENLIISDNEDGLQRNNSEIEWLIKESLKHVLHHVNVLQITPNRIWNILQKYTSWPEGHFYDLRGAVTDILVAQPVMLTELIYAAFKCYDTNTLKWAAFNYIRSALHDAPTVLQLSLQTYKALKDERYDESKSRHLYALALTNAFGESQEHQEITYMLWELADKHNYLLGTREQIAVSEIEDWRIEQSIRIVTHKKKELAAVIHNKLDFEKNRDVIKKGENLGWLTHLGNVYWGLYSGSDRTILPKQRLLKEFGSELLPDVQEAILSAAKGPNTPTLHNVIQCIGTWSHYNYWKCYLAAITEIWQSEGTLAFSDEFLKTLVLIEALCKVTGEDRTNRISHPWLEYLQRSNPQILAETYGLLIEHSLVNSTSLSFSIDFLMMCPNLDNHRKGVLIGLLQRFNNFPGEYEEQLLDALLRTDCSREEISSLANLKLQKWDSDFHPLWSFVNYLSCDIAMSDELRNALDVSVDGAWTLIGLLGRLKQNGVTALGESTSRLKEILIALVAHFPNKYHPAGESYGLRNIWDGAQFLRGLISKISADPSSESTTALIELLELPEFETYQSHLKHSLTQQQQVYREANFQKPTWSQVVNTLSNQAPANVADLHALVNEHLGLLVKEIQNSDTDKYKFFWNCDVKKPRSAKVEDDCRDVLLELLRPKLAPHGINAEPEVDMAHSKRADIVVSYSGMKVPIELKRQHHKELWTAVEKQLHRLYTTDPESQGYGIYGIFWFGEKYHSEMPPPPNGLLKPHTAGELEKMLVGLLPEDRKQKTKVVVFDLSGSY